MLADYKEANDAKKAEEETAKKVLGITLVTKNTEQINVENEDQTNATSNNNIDVKDVIGNVGDDEESDEELNKLADIINTFTPARQKIRAIPKEAKVIGIKTTLRQNDGSMNSSVIPQTLRRNLEKLSSSISLGTNNKHKIINASKKEPKNTDGARAMIEAMFDEDSQNLANSCTRKRKDFWDIKLSKVYKTVRRTRC